MSIEEMRQVLDALELCNGAETADGIIIYTDKEITFLRQAIAEAEKKDVYWRAIEGILDEYGLEAVDFVADFRAALKAAEKQSAFTNGEAGTENCPPGGGGYPAIKSSRLIVEGNK